MGHVRVPLESVSKYVLGRLEASTSSQELALHGLATFLGSPVVQGRAASARAQTLLGDVAGNRPGYARPNWLVKT